MLKVKFIKYKNILMVDILEQGEEIEKGNFEFEHNGYSLISEAYVMIDRCNETLYLKGHEAKYYNTDVYSFNDEKELDEYVSGISDCIRAYNNTLTKSIKQAEAKEWVVE